MEELRNYKDKDLVGKSGKKYIFSGHSMLDYDGSYDLNTKGIYYIGQTNGNNNVIDYFNLNISYDIPDTFSYFKRNLINDDEFSDYHFFIYDAHGREDSLLKTVLDDLSLEKYLKPIL